MRGMSTRVYDIIRGEGRAMVVYGIMRGKGHVQVGAVMANDLILAMTSIHVMQNPLNKAEADAQRERYIFSESKPTVEL